ncbi:MAG: AarF/ABC1/UbiB kinase family protein [Pseudomonadales bacterium]|nr:AarF/ABC1/UbiB kinase family protein [Pseudomonadales bacterium]
MAKKKNRTSLDKIKTGKWQRQWSVARAGIAAGSGTAGKMLGTAFLEKEKRQQANKKIISQQAHYLARELGKLKGSIVKVGQLMALYGEHILSAEVTEALRTLEEQTISLSWTAIEPVLQQQLGKAYSEFDIEQDPIGAASLAQVHRAVHRPTGASVCLKVQYPEVVAAIDSDIDSIITLLKVLRLVSASTAFNDWVDEMRHLLHLEVDYLREAEMTRRFYTRLEGDAIFIVPQIYAEFCTASLLVNSYEKGLPVNSEAVAALSLVRRNRLAKAFLQLFIDELFVWGEIQTDPNFGNYRIFIDASPAHNDKIVLLDFGAVLHYDESFLQPVKDMLLGAYHDDKTRIRKGSIDLGIMQESFPDAVHADFSRLCCLLIEPLVHARRPLPDAAVNDAGQYCWAQSRLPRRAGKHAASSAMSKYFIVPPKEFAFLSRKLLGVYSFISALNAEFNPDDLLADF